ncbi:MAG: dihydroorotate dehydrogenase electron transfer subunit [Oscillospiraceae bacterium]|nr:dihydroorotate dehydrogenase electron transfer subunit [Oscillospiraceae bacterium]
MTGQKTNSTAPRESAFRLTENRALSAKVNRMRFEGDCGAISAPGQFVSLLMPEKFLRRPFSVCDWGEGWFTVLVERVGDGTAMLHALPCGTELSVLTGLGNGFTPVPESTAPLLVGGGSGLSPLVGLARRLSDTGTKPRVLLGFRDPNDRFGAELFPGLEVTYAEDVFSALREIPHDQVYACGSEAMMRELAKRDPAEGQYAFDVRMGCGFGACMGCSLRTPGGMKRVCKDGPVFRKEDLL